MKKILLALSCFVAILLATSCTTDEDSNNNANAQTNTNHQVNAIGEGQIPPPKP